MHLETLKVFCDVARRSSFSEGARENGISQSTASQSVQHLEEKLGVRLIDRSRRPLILTAEGRVFFEECRELVDRFSALVDRVRSASAGPDVAGLVRVASIYSVGLGVLTDLAGRFRGAYPKAECRLEYLLPGRVVDAVRDGSAELGLISFPGRWPDLAVIPWRSEEMVVAAYPGHRLAGRRSIGPADLDGEPYVGFDRGLAIRGEIDRFLSRGGARVAHAFDFDNIENMKRAVEARAGVSILPRPTLSKEIEAGSLVAVPFDEPKPSRPLAVIHRRDAALGPAASRFLELLAEAREARSDAAAGLAVAAVGGEGVARG